MTISTTDLEAKGQAARAAARKLARLSTTVKNQALSNIADALKTREADILAANARDIQAGKAAGLTEALLDRLLLNPSRLEGMAADVRAVAALSDPVGETFDQR